MRRLIAAEIQKLATLRSSRALLIAPALLAAVLCAASIASDPRATLATGSGLRGVLNAADVADLFALIVGVLSVAGERRWGTEIATFLITPRRERVIAAKLAVMLAVGAALGVLCVGATLAVAAAMLSAKGVALGLFSSTTLQVAAGVIATSALYGAIGVGFGALVPNQPVAVSAALLWSLVVENALLALWGAGARWLPGGAAASLTRAALPYGGHLLAQGVGLVLLIAYGLAFAFAGAARTRTRALA